MINNTESLRKAIKNEMDLQGISLFKVAKDSKISLPAFSRFMKGSEKGLGSSTMFKVLHAIGIVSLSPNK